MRNRLKRIFFFLLCLPLILCSAGCENIEENAVPAESATAVTFTDALGTTVTVDRPQTVVACMGGLADIWLLAGGQDSLAGIADDADFTVSDQIAKIGAHDAPSPESILALNPDFVILSAATAEQVALDATLTQAGIPHAYFDVNAFEDYLNTLRLFSEITGHPESYQEYGVSVQKDIEATIDNARNQTPPTVLLLITYSQGVRAQTSDTMTGAMLKDLGCVNLADENPSLLQTFSVEAIVEMDPDFIFVIPMGYSENAAAESLTTYLESNPAWAGLSAVQTGGYHVLDPELFQYKPNDQWSESYAKLAEILYEQ